MFQNYSIVNEKKIIHAPLIFRQPETKQILRNLFLNSSFLCTVILTTGAMYELLSFRSSWPWITPRDFQLASQISVIALGPKKQQKMSFSKS